MLANKSVDRQKQKGKQDEDDDRSTATNETSFAQSGGNMCYWCGKKGHKSPQCPEKDTRPKDQWAVRKTEKHLQVETNRDVSNSDDDESISSNNTTGTNRSSQRAGWSGL